MTSEWVDMGLERMEVWEDTTVRHTALKLFNSKAAVFLGVNGLMSQQTTVLWLSLCKRICISCKTSCHAFTTHFLTFSETVQIKHSSWLVWTENNEWLAESWMVCSTSLCTTSAVQVKEKYVYNNIFVHYTGKVAIYQTASPWRRKYCDLTGLLD